MQRLYIERFYLNRADDEYPMTVRIILQIKDDVDRHLLEEAVAAAQTRYPYLCVKLGVERDADGSEHYVYHDNPRPWKVSGCRRSSTGLPPIASSRHCSMNTAGDATIVS